MNCPHCKKPISVKERKTGVPDIRCDALTTPRWYAKIHRCPNSASWFSKVGNFCGTHIKNAPSSQKEAKAKP
jgi:hypothetical protein